MNKWMFSSLLLICLTLVCIFVPGAAIAVGGFIAQVVGGIFFAGCILLLFIMLAIGSIEEECPRENLGYNCKGKDCDHGEGSIRTSEKDTNSSHVENVLFAPPGNDDSAHVDSVPFIRVSDSEDESKS